MEEKYRKAMVSNAQLHNEKSTLMYHVETLREELSDMEELLWETRRHQQDTSKVRGQTRWEYTVDEQGTHRGHTKDGRGSFRGLTGSHDSRLTNRLLKQKKLMSLILDVSK